MELLWRWSFGLGLLALLFFAYAHLRQAILLSDADQSALSGQDPFALPPRPRTSSPERCRCCSKLRPGLRRGGRALDCRRHPWPRNHHPDHRAPLCRRLLVSPIAPDAPRWTFVRDSHVRPRADAADSRHRLSRRIIARCARQRPRTELSLLPRSSSSPRWPPPACFGAMSTGCFRWRRSLWCATRSRHWIPWSPPLPLSAATARASTAIALWNSTLRGAGRHRNFPRGNFHRGSCTSRYPPWSHHRSARAGNAGVLVLISDIFLLARLAAYASVAVRELTLPQSTCRFLSDRSGTHRRA